MLVKVVSVASVARGRTPPFTGPDHIHPDGMGDIGAIAEAPYRFRAERRSGRSQQQRIQSMWE